MNYIYSKWELLGLFPLQLRTVIAQKITLIRPTSVSKSTFDSL